MLSQSSATDHKRNQNREIYYSQVPEKTPWGATGWGQSMVQRERENIGHMFLSGESALGSQEEDGICPFKPHSGVLVSPWGSNPWVHKGKALGYRGGC